MKIGRNDPCWCGSGQKYKKCHEAFDSKLDMFRSEGRTVPDYSIIKTPEQIEGIPAPLNYEGFPKSVCTSINNEVCHGIPDPNIILKNGDIINVDVSTIYNGYFSDSSRMFMIGDVDEDKKKLVETAKESLQIGLDAVKPWTPLGDMSYAINSFAEAHGYTVVREIGGHGCGLKFHEDPWVGYTIPKGSGMIMVPGMVFTIEPMINMGKADIFIDSDNGWTAYTEDGLPSAQWEIQILVTETGAEIITY